MLSMPPEPLCHNLSELMRIGAIAPILVWFPFQPLGKAVPMTDRDFSRGPARPIDVANMRPRLRRPATTPPPESARSARAQRFVQRHRRGTGEDSTRQVDPDIDHRAGVDRKLNLEELFGLIADLIVCGDSGAAVVLLEQLGSSGFAQAELTCTHAAFKYHLTQLLDKHIPEESKRLSSVVQRSLDEKRKRRSSVHTGSMTTMVPLKTSDANGSMDHSDRPGRCRSLSTARTAPPSMLKGQRSLGASSTQKGAGGAVAPHRTSLRHDGLASSVHQARAFSNDAHNHVSVDDSGPSTQVFFRHEDVEISFGVTRNQGFPSPARFRDQ